MSDTSDPRTRGFNYGVGWGSDPKPPVFLTAAKLARDLGKRAAELNREAWALEMAVRHVRVACTIPEKAQAIAKLEAMLSKYPTQEA